MIETYKIVFLGNTAVGKTTIISQYLHRRIEDPSPTIGMDYVVVNREVEGRRVSLQIWDTAGQEKFQSLISNYTRDAFLAIIVFGVDDGGSVEKLETWINEFVFRQNKKGDTHLMIVGNKIDLLKGGVSEGAEAGQGMSEAVASLRAGQEILKKGREIAERVGAKFVLASGLKQEGIEELREAINELVKEHGGTSREQRVQIMVKTRKRCGC